MASIKERAAALNLAEKLCVRSQAPVVTSKSVQSASLWSGLIFHLRSCVTVKHRRVHLKTHSDCFLGSEAVDVVAEHMNGLRGFEGVEVSRDKVVCVCQALLDCSVFESVGTKVFGKDKKQDEFQDSKTALYRFVKGPTPSADELERVLLVNGIQKLFCGPSSYRPGYQACSPGSHVKPAHTVTKTNQLDTRMTGSLLVEPVLDRPSVSPGRVQTDTVVPQSLVDELWQEQTLLRLLSLVELPLLEGILQCSQIPSSPLPPHLQKNQDQTYDSIQLDRQILRAFRDTLEDEWLRAALDCLDFLPDQPVVELSRELPQCFPQYQESCDLTPAGSSTQDADGRVQSLTFVSPINDSKAGLAQGKLLLYRALVKHYSQADRPPLMPRYMTDIYTAITDLLLNTKLGTALEALQLCLKLLPHRYREELRRLLTFMSLAADPQGIRLDKEMENRLAVKKSFSRAVFHNKSLTKEKEDLMVNFMLSNVEEIFKIPGSLHKEVSDQLASAVDGKLPDVTGSTFCQQVSSRSYTDSTRDATNQELRALLTSIHLDTKISEKEKKRLLRQFYTAHPEIFSQYFGDSAPNML